MGGVPEFDEITSRAYYAVRRTSVCHLLPPSLRWEAWHRHFSFVPGWYGHGRKGRRRSPEHVECYGGLAPSGGVSVVDLARALHGRCEAVVYDVGGFWIGLSVPRRPALRSTPGRAHLSLVLCLFSLLLRFQLPLIRFDTPRIPVLFDAWHLIICFACVHSEFPEPQVPVTRCSTQGSCCDDCANPFHYTVAFACWVGV